MPSSQVRHNGINGIPVHGELRWATNLASANFAIDIAGAQSEQIPSATRLSGPHVKGHPIWHIHRLPFESMDFLPTVVERALNQFIVSASISSGATPWTTCFSKGVVNE